MNIIKNKFLSNLMFIFLFLIELKLPLLLTVTFENAYSIFCRFHNYSQFKAPFHFNSYPLLSTISKWYLIKIPSPDSSRPEWTSSSTALEPPVKPPFSKRSSKMPTSSTFTSTVPWVTKRPISSSTSTTNLINSSEKKFARKAMSQRPLNKHT